VEAFNVTRTFGGRTKVMLDEGAGVFIVSSSGRWKDENPDVINFSQVTGCQTEIRETKTEEKQRDDAGGEVSYSPPRYNIDYDFYITIHVNSPWFNEINFKINDNRVDRRGSVEYMEMERQANEIRAALTEVRQNLAAASAPKVAQLCPNCGATTIPDASGRCEFCGGAVQE
jgi:hypothetical protein